jgi:hypothetical protein
LSRVRRNVPESHKWLHEYRTFQLWRLVTCFFFDKLGLNFAVNLYFLYKNSLELETTLFAGRTADYVFFVLFQMVTLLAAGIWMKMMLLTEGLILAIIYLWAQFYRDRTVSFMFGFQFKVRCFRQFIVV